jgi:4-amino-4-deoxy-L-arabinose transferase-like glycosyltransferase
MKAASAALAVCLLFAAAVLPSLGRLDFFDGVEHFNLATVQEMRRNEAAGRPVNWMLPTLQGEARVVKPPVTAWIAALLVSPADVAKLSNPDDAVRDRAMSDFVFRARLPTLACSCLMLLGVFVLGRSLAGGDWRVGAVAALACASTVLFFQQGRRATTDLQLAVWVTWTNALLAAAWFQRRVIIGYVGGGLAIGLASMAKGPHIALLMTVVPFAAFALLTRGRNAATEAGVASRPSRRDVRLCVAAGVLAALVVGLWWYVHVAATVPGIGDTWYREVTRHNAQVGRNVMTPDPWYAYTSFLGLLLPWTGWVVLGAGYAMREYLVAPSREQSKTPAAAHATDAGPVADEPSGSLGSLPTPQDGVVTPTATDAPASAARPLLLAVLLVLVPVLVMSFFSERKDRYLLPFVGPAAVLAGWAVIRWWDDRRAATAQAAEGNITGGSATRRLDRTLGSITGGFTFAAAGWLALSVVVAGAAGVKGYRTAADQPWFSVQGAVVMGVAVVFLLGLGLIRSRRSLIAPLLAVATAGWLGGELRLQGLAASAGDNDDRPQRELASRIWHAWPDAIVYSTDPVTLYGQLNRPAIVLSMRLNRVIETRPAVLPATVRERPVVLVTDMIGAAPRVPPGVRRIAEVPLRTGRRYVDLLSGEAGPEDASGTRPGPSGGR